VAVLAFASAGPTIIHGASFRADPISAFFILLSLVMLAKGRASLGPMLLAGTFAAIAAIITIKVGLYAPAFVGIILWRLSEKEERRQTLVWIVGVAITASAAFAALYLLQLSLVERASNIGSQALLGNAARATLIEGGFLSKWPYIIRAIRAAPTQTVMLIAGAAGIFMAFVRGSKSERLRLLVIGCCGAPLLCLLIYRNAYPYFYPFIFPPAMLLIAWVTDWSTLLKRPIVLILVGAAMVGPAVYVAKVWSEAQAPPQRELIDGIHTIFPEPVPMIDGPHMVSSFPKRGFFMSIWGIANYHRGKPIFAGLLRRDVVPLLLINNVELADAVNGPPLPPNNRLFEEDRSILSHNYIQHWGPVWVAGKQLSGGQSEFAILIPGIYTLEGEGLVIDGKSVARGATLYLTRGRHKMSAASSIPRVLRWGDHLKRPAQQPPQGPAFRGF
jgi:hypothetical protein